MILGEQVTRNNPSVAANYYTTSAVLHPTTMSACAASPFDHPKADVILRSSDGIDFYVFKLLLAKQWVEKTCSLTKEGGGQLAWIFFELGCVIRGKYFQGIKGSIFSFESTFVNGRSHSQGAC